MARVTVEDCVEKIPNRFELVMTAAQRARQIGSGAALKIDRDNDKNTVVALREIAEDAVSIDDLQEDLVRNYQRIIEDNDEDEAIIDMMDGEEEWGRLTQNAASTSEPVREEDDLDDDESGLADLAGEIPDDEDDI